MTGLAQNGAVQRYCDFGASQAIVSGLRSSNYQQGDIPQCTVTVYLTGTTTLAPIYTASTSTATVGSISVTAGGTYSVCPTGISLSGGGGTGAAATPSCTGTAVTSVAVTNPGSGYTSAPTISFTGGTGSGATATANMTGNLTNPFVANADGSYLFYALQNQGLDVQLSGGIFPNTYPTPNTLVDVFPNQSFSPVSGVTQLSATGPIEVNGGSGPVTGSVLISCPSCGSGSTTNALTMNNSGSGASSGSTFNGSSAITLSYNTLGAAPTASPIFTGIVDASGATQFKLPVAAGYTSAANGEIGYDSTNKNFHAWVNGADTLLIPLASGFTSGHCGQPTSSGGSWTIVDAGAACGTGSGGVTSLNSLTGGINLTSTSSTITITPGSSTIDLETSGGGGGGLPSNALFICAGDSMCDDDNHVLSPAIAIASFTVSGSTVTVNTSAAHGLTSGNWVSMRAATGWPQNVSPMGLGTGLTIFQATVTSSTQFTLNVGSRSVSPCSSSCGNAYSAMPYVEFAKSANPLFPSGALTNTATCMDTGYRLQTLASDFSGLISACVGSTTGKVPYVTLTNANDDVALCETAAQIEGYYQTIFSAIHAINGFASAMTATGANWATNTLGCSTHVWDIQEQVDLWLRQQSKQEVQATSPGSTAYWDALEDIGPDLTDANNTALIATNTGFGPEGAARAAQIGSQSLLVGNGTSEPRNTLWFRAINSNAAAGINSLSYVPRNGTTNYLYQWFNSSSSLVASLTDSGIFSPTYLNVGSNGLSGCPGGRPFCIGTGFNIDSSNVLYVVHGINADSGGSSSKYWATDGSVQSVPSGGFPITIGSTSIASGSTTTTIAGLTLSSPAFTGTADASGSTQFKLPVAAGYTSAANGEIGYDSTNKNFHAWVNGADTLLIPLASGFTSGHCGQPTSSGGSWTIVDAGGACGTSGGGAAWSALTSGTNTSMSAVMGSGSSLGYTGTGAINASAVDGVTVTGTPSAGQVPTATSGTAATWQTPSSGTGNFVNIGASVAWSGCTYSGGVCTTSGSSTSSITISSIPSTYLSLVIRVVGGIATSGSNADVGMQFNGDTGNHYDRAYNYYGNTNAQGDPTNSAFVPIGTLAGGAGTKGGTMTATIENYAGTTTYYRQFHSEGYTYYGGPEGFQNSGDWQSTSAITSITLVLSSGDYYGTNFEIYGTN